MTKVNESLNFSAFSSYEQASKAVLSHLKETLGFSLWMTTRTNKPDWIVLEVLDDHYNVAGGDVFKWADSFCSEMINGNGPNIAQNSDEIPAYAAAEIGRQVPISAYIGTPIMSETGELFGTLCAIDPNPQTVDIEKALPTIQIFAKLLSTLLEKDLEIAKKQREYDQLNIQAHQDSLTSLLNRSGWNKALANEQERFKTYGSPMAIFILDLDNLKQINDIEGHKAGDEQLKKAALLIKQIIPNSDIAARLGGDEFAILSIETSFNKAQLLLENLEQKFTEDEISISIGYSIHDPSESVTDTMSRADKKMYENKMNKRKDQALEINPLATKH